MVHKSENRGENGDDVEYEMHESEETFEVHMFSRILRGVIALIALVGLLYFSGIYQYFFYQRTSESIEQTPIESRVDAETLTVPFTVFIVKGAEPHGSVRTEENALHLTENASRIWDQAGIMLEVQATHVLIKSDEEINLFFENPRAFIRQVETFDPKTINVFLLGSLRGINGIAFGGLGSVAVADYTTVYDFRTLAHEVGHILGLSHVPEFRGRLMFRGANGFELSPEEIERARIEAQRF